MSKRVEKNIGLVDRNKHYTLKDALGLVDIRVLDHLIVGDTRCVSLAERGVI